MGRWRSEVYQAVDKEKYQVQCYDLRDDLALLLAILRQQGGRDAMIKTSISLQDLRMRIYIKAKAYKS